MNLIIRGIAHCNYGNQDNTNIVDILKTAISGQFNFINQKKEVQK